MCVGVYECNVLAGGLDHVNLRVRPLHRGFDTFGGVADQVAELAKLRVFKSEKEFAM
jgi:hypothetical protein